MIGDWLKHRSSWVHNTHDCHAETGSVAMITGKLMIILNNNNEILIEREPLVYTRARRAVQKRKKEKTKG